MLRSASRLCLLVALCLLLRAAPLWAADPPKESLGKVYGEWRIFVKPDQGTNYDALIASKGLPLFRAAGGRMVGWWKPLIGNLYEHVTIWEYDDMAAFEKAVGFLGGSEDFAKFVALRDPLLAGEESRFLHAVAGGTPPALPDAAKFVIHEIHRVPLKKQKSYLDFANQTARLLLEKHGFRPVGPFTTAVGRWSEVTWLFRFDSLAERDRLIAKFIASADGQRYSAELAEQTDEVETRLLLPAPFARSAEPVKTSRAAVTSPLLPHLEQLSEHIWAAGFADQFRSANCGFVAGPEAALLIDLPRGVPVDKYAREVERITGKAPRRLILTHAESADASLVEGLVAAGVQDIVGTREARTALLGQRDELPFRFRLCEADTDVGDSAFPVRFLPADGTAAPACAAVLIPSEDVLFAGPLVVHGPRARLAQSDTAAWIDRLRNLETLTAKTVVPGFGSWGAHATIHRQRRFLEELRSQVSYAVALGKAPEALEKHVRISPELQVWMPYDNPIAEDLLSLYRELTVPRAPFNDAPPRSEDARPHALVLIGDGPHEPTHLERGLRPALLAAGIEPHFTVDVRALAAENLARVQLLVVLRDGLMRPTDDPKSFYCWVTREQERAVVEFVERGGGFLNLHNSLGLYPDEGPYLQLAAGKYVGHGPLERFRVEVADADHPITRGISPFFAADEQHTPVVDSPRVHLLLRNQSDAGVVGAAGWTREPGKGRFCHLASGHTRDALEHPTYQKLLSNAMRWCVRRDEQPRAAAR